ncbi:MAG: hypothetical protein HY782_09380 [Chloroflexi bacterium]|nr:hypothetical protein [Chloroflexota bacterium]
MNNRSRTLAILNYQPYDRLPVVHFGFWRELLELWAAEGHLTAQQATDWQDGNVADAVVSKRLGFDYDWLTVFNWHSLLYPPIEKTLIEERADGSRLVLNKYAQYVIEKPGIVSIPMEVDHLLKSRKDWEEFFIPRLRFDERRYLSTPVIVDGQSRVFAEGGLEFLRGQENQNPFGIYCGSLLGEIRTWLGVVGMSYLMVDDKPLFHEIIEVVSDLAYRGVQAILATGAHFDFAHFWEDICYKNGPLVNPRFFAETIGPHYRRITELLHSHGIHLVSLDCDGMIDALIPTWINNGVNTMFPIEVGTWDANIAPWRAKYGKEIRGVGGVDKKVFAQDYAAIDAEIERMRPLVALGGFIPCPDHRLPLGTKWENVQYYCDRMRQTFG